MTTNTLLLNADYSPLTIVAWQKAIVLLLDEKVGLVADYSGRVVRSSRLTMPWPAVVALVRYTRFRDKISFNRMHIIARDGARCQYCGVVPRNKVGRLKIDELTMDHVVPRSRAVGGHVVLPWNRRRVPVSCWENVVTACEGCNRRKAARTPAEAGMTLRSLPGRPSSKEALRANFMRARVPEEWRSYLPADIGVVAS